jgi:hypothetical protein
VKSTRFQHHAVGVQDQEGLASVCKLPVLLVDVPIVVVIGIEVAVIRREDAVESLEQIFGSLINSG